MSVLPHENNISMVGVGLLGRTTSGAGKSSRLSAASVRSLCSVYSTSEVDTLLAGYQPLDSDLTAIAALTTTSFGRSLLTQADAPTARTTLGAIGGSVGATTNRLVKSSGTDTLTVQSTGITVDASNNVSGVGTFASGAITANGAVNFQNGSGVTYAAWTGSGRVFYAGGDAFAVRTSTGGTYLFNAGFLAVTNSTDASSATADTFLSRESAGVWRMGTTSTGSDAGLKCGAITASALMCAGAYTVATLPSASSNAGKFAQVTDSSVTTFGSTVSGGGSNRVPVFSNGTNWVVA